MLIIKKGIKVIYRINSKWETGFIISNDNGIYKVNNSNKIIAHLYPIYEKGDKIIYKKKIDNSHKFYRGVIIKVNITPDGLDYQIKYLNREVETIPSRILVKKTSKYYTSSNFNK